MTVPVNSARLSLVPKTIMGQNGMKDASASAGGAVAAGLLQGVANTYRLIFKTHAYHWNVEGRLFCLVHHLTDEQYNEMFPAADALAQRLRALGHRIPVSLVDVMALSVIKDLEAWPSTVEMVVDLANDHAAVAVGFYDLIKLADENTDQVTAALARRRATFHEQAAWMLRVAAQ